MTPSIKQQAIYDLFDNTDHNILVQAVAGSGKTTLITGLIKRATENFLYLAFNKSIKMEVEAKFIQLGINNGQALTLHALGLSAVRSALYKIQVETGKNYKLYRSIEDQLKGSTKGMKWEDRQKLMFTLFDFNDVSRLFLTDDFDTIVKRTVEMDKVSFEHPKLKDFWGYMLQARELEYEKDVNKQPVMIDFLDMIYLPARLGLHIPVSADYLMIDECQDLNLCQHKIIDLLLSQGNIKKWVSVGDRNQSIYGFAGATPESFNLFLARDNVKEMPLDICYRCPATIIKSVNNVYNVMIGHKTEEGETIEYNNLLLKDINHILPILNRPNTMLICRNKNPLIKMLFALLKLNVPAVLAGEDILNSVINFLKPYKSLSLEVAEERISKDLSSLSITDAKSEQEKIKYYVLRENYNNFMVFKENLAKSPYELVSALTDKISHLFDNADPVNTVKLCTIHRSKGLEADYVGIINEKLIPSKFAKSPTQLIQEKNLMYVARSRAEKSLMFLNFKDFVNG